MKKTRLQKSHATVPLKQKKIWESWDLFSLLRGRQQTFRISKLFAASGSSRLVVFEYFQNSGFISPLFLRLGDGIRRRRPEMAALRSLFAVWILGVIWKNKIHQRVVVTAAISPPSGGYSVHTVHCQLRANVIATYFSSFLFVQK